MKEAAGEANMTVITIVLIAIVLAVGTVVVNNVMNNTAKSGACQTAGGAWKGGKCCKKVKDDGTCDGELTCTKASADDATTGVKKGDWSCVG